MRTIKTLARGLTAGIILAGAALGLAGPASAQLDEGGYTWTSAGGISTHWVLSSCGQNCMTVRFSNGEVTDLHLDGNTWTGTDAKGCTRTIDNNSLAGRNDCPSLGVSTGFQLTRN